MPFKSEKQRKYLWANEPEIARDWTETYGSKVKKADGGRIGFYRGSDRHGGTGRSQSQAPSSGPHGNQGNQGSSRSTTSNTNTRDGGGGRRENYRPTYTKPTTKPTPPKGGYGLSNKTLDRGGIKSYLNNIQNKANTSVINKKIQNTKDLIAYLQEQDELLSYKDPNFLGENRGYSDKKLAEIASRKYGAYPEVFVPGQGKISPVTNVIGNMFSGPGSIEALEDAQARLAQLQGLTGTETRNELIDMFGPKGFVSDVNDPRHPQHNQGGSGGGINNIYPYTEMASAPIQEEEIEVADVADVGLGSGHFRLPERFRLGAARGGVMDMVDRESIIKTPDEEIVTNQMEEIEGQMTGPEWFTRRVEALMYEGYSYEEASEIAYTEGPGGDYAQGGRVPAAFGGIMDTSTGRRGYFLGSVGKAISKPFKKAAKAVKKLISSPIGKLAMMYAAGTYLGGSQFMSGQAGGVGPGGFASFTKRLKNPKLLANFLKTDQWGTAGKAVKNLGKVDVGFQEALRKKAVEQKNKSLLSKGLGFLRDNPTTAILGSSLGAGLLTDKMPVEELDQADNEYDAEKEAFDAYLASLGGSYRVPDEYILAKGGRVGRQEGGLMDMGGMEKDYRNDGGFVPIGGEEKADDVPARLSRNEFVFTADAVRSAGGGDIDKGAEVMENVMKNLEAGGKVSEESQGKGGAQEMFEVSERLSEVM